MTTKKTAIDSARVEQLLERYGADPKRFPEADRELDIEQVAQDPQLAELLKSARHLDALLDTSIAQSPSAELMRRVAEVPLHHPRTLRVAPGVDVTWSPLTFLRAVVTGLAAASLGVWVGMTALPYANDAGYNNDEIEELASLTFADDFAFEASDGETP